MKRFFKKLMRGTAIAVVLIFGLFLIAFAVLRDVDWSWLKSAIDPPEQTTKTSLPDGKPRLDEVQKYTLFTHVNFGDKKVTTGVQYASTASGKIELQWCYLTDNKQLGAARTDLYLAQVEANGKKTVPEFSSSELAKFDLTKETAKSLVKSHCRFK